MIEANHPALKSWIEVPSNSDFPIQNIPFGVVEVEYNTFVATRIGDTVINLYKLAQLDYFNNIDPSFFNANTLNDFMLLGKQVTRDVRSEISAIFNIENDVTKKNKELKEALISIDEVQMLMPIKFAEYTDFYSSEQHARNVGSMFRDKANALLPNWKHLPVAYHGRASSIIVSEQPIYRPRGQQKTKENNLPIFGWTKALDFELEMAFITYEGKPLGESISTQEAEEYIFGMCLFNDWSARDIQKWEYIPLGPFLGKNFASSISPWIVTLDALEAFRVSGPMQNPRVLDYLKYEGDKHIDINLQVAIQPEGKKETVVTSTNYKNMYWNMNQQLAHHTINGCNINLGDIMASGTISGNEKHTYGSMLEITKNGTFPIQLEEGIIRKFIEDNDTIIMRGYAEKNDVRVGFGELITKVLPE